MPVDHYFISYEELEPYINREGPLGFLLKQRYKSTEGNIADLKELL